jgi:UDP-N-acetylglucosamine--N-acetylmuramyl-(pentapeptide) pyrophosphoryl-undecaprenol N-acetylglucosamine transferase
MIAVGGTGGHIYPAIAIAREWSRAIARRAIFVGTEKDSRRRSPKAGFRRAHRRRRTEGKGGLDLLRNVLRVPRG